MLIILIAALVMLVMGVLMPGAVEMWRSLWPGIRILLIAFLLWLALGELWEKVRGG